MVKRKNQNDKQWSTKHNTENKRLSIIWYGNRVGPKAKFPKRHKSLRILLYDIHIENKRILYKRSSIITLNHMNVFTWCCKIGTCTWYKWYNKKKCIMKYRHVAMINTRLSHLNSSKVKCMSSAKYDQIYCIVIFTFTHVLLIMIKTDLIEIEYYLYHKFTTIFLTCQSIGCDGSSFKYYLIHLNILITFPESSQWTPPFSPFPFS